MFTTAAMILISVIMMALSGIVKAFKAVKDNTDNTSILFYAGATCFLIGLIVGCVQILIAM